MSSYLKSIHALYATDYVRREKTCKYCNAVFSDLTRGNWLYTCTNGCRSIPTSERPSFVYVIVNRINGKKYVGKSINPEKRFKGHKQYAKKGSMFSLHCAIRKYGEENFELYVYSHHLNENDAFNAEVKLIRDLKTVENGYNMNEGGEGGYSPNELVRQKISNSNSGKKRSKKIKDCESEQRSGVGNPMFGRKHTEETLQKMREKRKLFWQKKNA